MSSIEYKQILVYVCTLKNLDQYKIHVSNEVLGE